MKRRSPLNTAQFREKQDNWRIALISYKHANGKGFNARTIRLAIALQHHEHATEGADQGTAWPGRQRLAEMVGIGGSRETQLREVSRALKPLAEAGFIVKIREGKSVNGEEVVTAKWRLVVPDHVDCVGVQHNDLCRSATQPCVGVQHNAVLESHTLTPEVNPLSETPEITTYGQNQNFDPWQFSSQTSIPQPATHFLSLSKQIQARNRVYVEQLREQNNLTIDYDALVEIFIGTMQEYGEQRRNWESAFKAYVQQVAESNGVTVEPYGALEEAVNLAIEANEDMKPLNHRPGDYVPGQVTEWRTNNGDLPF